MASPARPLVPIPPRAVADPDAIRRARYLTNVAEILDTARRCEAAGVELPELRAAICTRCGQVGRAEPLLLLRGVELRRWTWNGRNALGELVHLVVVTQARHVGPPPTLCPDHEAIAIAAGTASPPELALQLTRKAVRL